MPDEPVAVGATYLQLDAYLADYSSYFEHADADMWKLERGQSFQEPDEPAWQALVRGDWAQAIELPQRYRPEFAAMGERVAAMGVETLRARVVEYPISPYLQWELHFLRVRAEMFEQIRVVTTDQMVDVEVDGPVPEIVTVGTHVAYEVDYDATGLPVGALKFTDPPEVRRRIELARSLYERGEDLESFFQREIAPLPPTRQPA